MNIFVYLVPMYLTSFYFLGAAITALLFVGHVAVVPLLFKYTKGFKRTLIFANTMQWPLFINYEEPYQNGIGGSRNLSLEYFSKVDRCDVKLGAWHILPKASYERLRENYTQNLNLNQIQLNQLFDEELAKSKTPIIFYCHGNSCNRGAAHRIQLYKFFQQMNFHTIAFDYRGYGDSTEVLPTERGVVEDAIIVYEWLINLTNKHNHKPPIFVWGHSLGTGVSAHLLGNLGALSKELLYRRDPLPLPKGLILEAPFNNLADEVANHPLSKLVSWLPYYHSTFILPFKDSTEHEFLSDQHLMKLPNLPILMLHAEDDMIVPYKVGLMLYKTLKQSRKGKGGQLKFHTYEKKLELGHKWICEAEDLSKIVGEFVTRYK